jgi:hypothetical protein
MQKVLSSRSRLQQIVGDVLWGIKRMKTKWDHATQQRGGVGSIPNLKKPIATIEYVLAHELVHLRVHANIAAPLMTETWG